MQSGLGEIYAKGLLLFFAIIELLVLRSNGYKQFQIKTLMDNIKFSSVVATGLAYQQNNIKNEKVI